MFRPKLVRIILNFSTSLFDLFVNTSRFYQRSQYLVLQVAGDIYLSLECCLVARWGLPSSEIEARIDNLLSKEVADAGCSKTLRSPPLRVMQVNPCTLRDTTRLRDFLGQCRAMQIHIVCCTGTQNAMGWHLSRSWLHARTIFC